MDRDRLVGRATRLDRRSVGTPTGSACPAQFIRELIVSRIDQSHPDQRTVTLTMLSRLHDLLGSSGDEMLLANRVAKGLAEHDPDAIDDIDAAVHAQTLLAVSRDGVERPAPQRPTPR